MIIDGREISQQILQSIQERIQHLSFKPVLCDIIVGDDKVSMSYVKIKQRVAEKCGLDFVLVNLPRTSNLSDVVGTIHKVQEDKNLCGLIVQLPLPEHLNTKEILNAIDLKVDVDLLSEKSSEQFYAGSHNLIPPTAAAIWHILQDLKIDLTTKNILVIGQGQLVGMPITYLLKSNGFNVNIATKDTADIKALTKNADIIISGAGKDKLLSGDMVKDGVIIIDAGTSEVDGGIAGDVDFQSVAPKAQFITPVPGGVGPVTVAKLIENVATVAEEMAL